MLPPPVLLVLVECPDRTVESIAWHHGQNVCRNTVQYCTNRSLPNSTQNLVLKQM